MKSLVLILILNLGILQAESDVHEFKKKSLEHSFKLGYEYRTVENTLNKGSVRLELSSYYIPSDFIHAFHIDTRFLLINKDEKVGLNTSIDSKIYRQSLSINLIFPITRICDISLLNQKHDGFLGLITEYGLTKYDTIEGNSGANGKLKQLGKKE